MIYCDTSLIVAALAFEQTTSIVQEWLSAQSPAVLCASDWVGTELSSALSMKVRRGELSLEERADALMQWRLLLAEAVVSISLPAQAWDLAASYCDRHELKLRAADALHLAVASLGGHAVATLDVAMADAAVAIGLRVERVLA